MHISDIHRAEGEPFTNAEIADFNGVIALLAPVHDRLPLLGRRLLIDSAVRIEQWQSLVHYGYPPRAISEVGAVVRALCELGRFEDARGAISEAGVQLGLQQAQASELRQFVEIKEAFGRNG